MTQLRKSIHKNIVLINLKKGYKSIKISLVQISRWTSKSFLQDSGFFELSLKSLVNIILIHHILVQLGHNVVDQIHLLRVLELKNLV